MYKILIKYNTSSSMNNLWQFHGTTSYINAGSLSESTFTEFKTDDMAILEEEVKKLDMELGHAYIKIIKEIDYDVLVDVDEDEVVKLPEDDLENDEDSQTV